MAKKVNKKSVMEEVHPDVIDRVEDFTDPEKIERARARIVDYAKVAEKFAANAELPEEEEILLAAAPAATIPVAATAVAAPEVDESFLLDELESGTTPVVKAPDADLQDLDDSDFDDLEALLGADADQGHVIPAPRKPDVVSDDFSDLDTDLLADLDLADDSSAGSNPALGQDAYGNDTLGTVDDDEEDFFGLSTGIPSEPTPYGDRSSKSQGVSAIEPLDDDDDADDLDRLMREIENEQQTPSAAPATGADADSDLPDWMMDDLNDADTPDVLGAAQRRAAETDDLDLPVFADADFDAPEDTKAAPRRVAADPDSLNAMLGLVAPAKTDADAADDVTAPVAGGAAAAAIATAVADADTGTVEAITTKTEKKKGMFSMFGKKKKVEKTEAVVTDADETVETTVVSETTVEDTDAGETVTTEDVKVTKKKKGGGFLKGAVSLLALMILGGGAYIAADQLGYLGGPQVVPMQSQPNTQPAQPDAPVFGVPPVPGEAPADATTTPAAADAPEGAANVPFTEDPAPVDVDPVPLPGEVVTQDDPALVPAEPVVETPAETIDPALDAPALMDADPVDTPIDGVPADAATDAAPADTPVEDVPAEPLVDAVPAPNDAGVTDSEVPNLEPYVGDVPADEAAVTVVDEAAVVVADGEGVPAGESDIEPDATANPDGSLDTTEGEPAVDDASADVLGDLYGVGISESEIAQQDAAQVSARLSELTTLLQEQKTSLDAALSRVKTLESVMVDRDAALATAQGEAETARQSAQEAKDMALAQNKVLIEVVGMRDKMQIAEDLIVDLSRRTAAIESDDSQTQQIRQLNDRITELTRDVGLLARTVLTSGQNLADQKAAQDAADRAHAQAQAAVDANAAATIANQTQAAPAGSGGVYESEGRLLTLPETSEIPADVEIGDDIPGYGEVLDISEMEDGSRLVVMENDSKVIPRQ